MTRPCLKITGLHIEGLRSLQRVGWPEDGLGWGGEVPDLVLVGGLNGSGKTTLLELLFGAVKAFRGWNPGNLHKHAFNAWIDILIRSDETGEAHYRFVVGDQDFVSSSSKGDCLGLVRQPNGGYVPLYKGETWEVLHEFTQDAEAYESSSIPGAIYLPADRRFVLPEEKYKSPGRLEMRQDFFFRLNKPKSWKDSVEALLYAARWEDLNAIAEGRPGEARHFDAYAAAFHAFFGQAKSLIWDRGELFIRMADTGQLHSIAELSSGEQQVLLLVGELYRRWRPGSLILIDEPELHFHSSWQTCLWSTLVQWQRERGGQVILATQSNHLFTIAEPGTKVMLAGGDLT